MSDDRRQHIQSLGSRAMLLLHGIAKGLILYEPNNQAILRQVDDFEKVVFEFLTKEDQLRLQLREDEFFANGKLLRVDPASYERYTELSTILGRFDAGEVRFEKGVTRKDIDAMIEGLGPALRAQDVELERTFGQIRFASFRGRSMASFRLEPDMLAVWLYTGLLDVTERLYAAHAEGDAPSLRPIRRTLQLVIDSMRRHGGIYLILGQVRDHRAELSWVRQRVSIAIDSIGFGIWLGLDNAQVMVAGLGALLGGLSQDTDPEKKLKPLFRYPGLAETALPLMITVHDAAAARSGKPSGTPGRLVAVVEAAHEKADPLAVHPGVARLYLAFKGPFPLGAAVRLSDGRTGMVYSHGSDEEGKRFPVITVLEEGRPSEYLELRNEPDLTAEIVDAASIELYIEGADSAEIDRIEVEETERLEEIVEDDDSVVEFDAEDDDLEFEDEDVEDEDTNVEGPSIDFDPEDSMSSVVEPVRKRIDFPVDLWLDDVTPDDDLADILNPASRSLPLLEPLEE
ncbi:MAG: hypothetical protein GY913_05395 [Proteobacteria bacterium]|nr:hypothetical protein [Pseudomonadota bacterium]MCP4916337.1 hypothetical protein [Pseudomonadota bacterium]